MNFEKLIELGRGYIKYYKESDRIKVGDCVCLIESKNKNLYVGYSYKFSHFGYCAEQAALLDMFAAEEFEAEKMVTITKSGHIIPPCGRCLELISQLSNSDLLEIAVGEYEIKNLNEIYPYDWKKLKN